METSSSKVVTETSDVPHQSSSSSSSPADVSKVSPSSMDEDVMKPMNSPSSPKAVAEGSDPVRVATGEEDHEEEISLEDFLANAGVFVREEDVRAGMAAPVGPGGAAFSGVCGGGFLVVPAPVPVGPVAVGGVGVRRGKRRVEEEDMDRAMLQKQRRMIKNRESAARSRQRKQVDFPF